MEDYSSFLLYEQLLLCRILQTLCEHVSVCACVRTRVCVCGCVL